MSRRLCAGQGMQNFQGTEKQHELPLGGDAIRGAVNGEVHRTPYAHPPRLPISFRRWLRQTRGQDLIEYALLAAFISVTALAAASALGTSVNGWYDAISGVIGGEEESSGSGKGSNCSATGMIASQGKCHGG